MKVLKGIFNAIKFVGNLLLPIIKLIPGVGLITNIFGLFKGLFNIIKFLAPIAKKLFLPLTIFMAVWDTIQGAMDGFEEEGIIGALKGGMSGLFNSLVGGLMDLVKDGVSWILTKFGFDNAAKFLDSFSFQDLYKDFLDLMFSIPGRLYDAILSALKSIPILGPKIKEMITSNMPDPTEVDTSDIEMVKEQVKRRLDPKIGGESVQDTIEFIKETELDDSQKKKLINEIKSKKSETSNLEKSRPDEQIKLVKEKSKSSENLKEASSNIKDSLETVNKTAKDSKKEIKSEKSKSAFPGIFDSIESSIQGASNLFEQLSPEVKGEVKENSENLIEGTKQVGKGTLNMLKGGMVGFLKMLKQGDIGAGIETMRDSIITTGSDLVKRGDIKNINVEKLSKTESDVDVNMGDLVTNPINFLSSVIGINDSISRPIPESKQTPISPEQLKQNVSGVQITGLENIKEFMQGSQNQNNVVSTNLNSVNAPSSNVVNTVNYINKDEEWTKKSFYNS